MGTCNLIILLRYEGEQFFDGWDFLAIGADMEDLSDFSIFPKVDLNALHP
jgi:hypothetical protein